MKVLIAIVYASLVSAVPGQFNYYDEDANVPKEGTPGYEGTQQPGYGGAYNPDFENNAPGYDINKPGYGTIKPEDGSDKPNYGNDEPNYESDKPNYDTGAPEHGNNKPEYGDDKPEHGNDEPEYGNDKPEYGTDKPEYGTDKPENGTDKPEYGTDKPDYGYDKPGSDTNYPGNGNNGSDNGNNNRPPACSSNCVSQDFFNLFGIKLNVLRTAAVRARINLHDDCGSLINVNAVTKALKARPGNIMKMATSPFSLFRNNIGDVHDRHGRKHSSNINLSGKSGAYANVRPKYISRGQVDVDASIDQKLF